MSKCRRDLQLIMVEVWNSVGIGIVRVLITHQSKAIKQFKLKFPQALKVRKYLKLEINFKKLNL